MFIHDVEVQPIGTHCNYIAVFLTETGKSAAKMDGAITIESVKGVPPFVAEG